MKIDIAQLEFIDSRLRKIVTDIEATTGFEFTITSLYRIGDDGVHGTLPLRGMDLRCRDKVIGEMIENEINSRYKYDPSRPSMSCCMYHDIGLGAHLHIQVHPNTVEVS